MRIAEAKEREAQERAAGREAEAQWWARKAEQMEIAAETRRRNARARTATDAQVIAWHEAHYGALEGSPEEQALAARRQWAFAMRPHKSYGRFVSDDRIARDHKDEQVTELLGYPEGEQA